MMKLIPLALTSSILLTASGFKLFDDSPRSHTLDKRNTPSWPKSAVARFIDGGVRGQVRFTQDRLDGDVSVQVDLTGLERGLHGFHVHESAITNGCVSAGAHFNPDNMTHGSPTDRTRHAGDLPPLNANDNRIVAQIFTDRIIKLDGRYSIIGRSIVIHRNADDFGRGTNEDSKRTGNAGDRVACATITTSNVLASQASPGQGPPPPQSQTPQRPSSPAPAPPSSGSTKAKIKWPIRAVALLSGAGVSGMVNFTQDNPRALVKIDVNIRGLKAGQQHGFHVHEFGVTDSCASAGGHFNPMGMAHGADSDSIRHVGDLRPIEANAQGTSEVTFTDRWIVLIGVNSIMGRSIVVHERPDDLGRGSSPDSKTTGNAGGRLACATIVHR